VLVGESGSDEEDSPMIKRFIGSMIVAAVLMGVFPLVTPAAGQSQPASARRDPLPRTPDGQPDIHGVWQSVPIGSGALRRRPERFSLEDIGLQGTSGTVRRGLSRIVDPADGKIPYQPWAAEQQRKIFANHWNPKPGDLDPQSRCFPQGVPRAMYSSDLQILQPPGHVVFLVGFGHSYRVVPLDGRPHLPEDIKLFMGDSRGRWDGNTLVVDVTNNNDKTWLDVIGSFHSDALHVVERFTVVDARTINYEATIEDPKVYTRPWKLALVLERMTEQGFELLEEACHEGERDVPHILRSADQP
jgi:hypothetical protein